jgi:hypothetical protein
LKRQRKKKYYSIKKQILFIFIQDEKRFEEEKENLGMLYYQKENKNFMEWLDEIEDIVKKEC